MYTPPFLDFSFFPPFRPLRPDTEALIFHVPLLFHVFFSLESFGGRSSPVTLVLHSSLSVLSFLDPSFLTLRRWLSRYSFTLSSCSLNRRYLPGAQHLGPHLRDATPPFVSVVFFPCIVLPLRPVFLISSCRSCFPVQICRRLYIQGNRFFCPPLSVTHFACFNDLFLSPTSSIPLRFVGPFCQLGHSLLIWRPPFSSGYFAAFGHREMQWPFPLFSKSFRGFNLQDAARPYLCSNLYRPHSPSLRRPAFYRPVSRRIREILLLSQRYSPILCAQLRWGPSFFPWLTLLLSQSPLFPFSFLSWSLNKDLECFPLSTFFSRM